MKPIPTAEEFLKNEYERLNIKRVFSGELKSWRDEDIIILKEFAKLHVETALKAVAEQNEEILDKRFIVEAYPLTNIK